MYEFPRHVKAMDGVPESFRALYGQTDNGFMLHPELAARFDEAEANAHLAAEAQQMVNVQNDELSRLRTTLEHYLIEATARIELAAQDGISELLLPHLRAALQVQEVDGVFEIYVVDAKGEIRQGVSVAALVTEMRTSETLGRAFEGWQPSNKEPAQTILTQQEARDPTKYRAAREKTIQAGQFPTILSR